MKFLNWSKGLTVKEKILVHLLNYNQYYTLEDVPEALTQQGISNSIFAPRPHVSMALKDLRNQKLIIERTSHIIQGKRRQKVYFLTSNGLQFTNNLNARIKEIEIRVIRTEGQRVQKLRDVCYKNNALLFELLTNITEDGFLDLTKPKRDTSLALSKSTKEITGPSAKHVSTQTLSSKIPPVRPDVTSELDAQKGYVNQTQRHLGQSGAKASAYDKTYEKTNDKTYDNYYNDYWRNQYPYYYQMQPSFQLSEKANIAFFYFGFFLILIGAFLAIYFFTVYEPLIIIPLILFITFGLTILFFSSGALWNNEKWQKRILNLMGITLPVIFYIMFFQIVDVHISFYDLGLWLVIMISLLMVGYFGIFIPIFNRIRAFGTLGMMIIIDAPIIFLLGFIEIFQVGFWLMFGVICIYLGYILLADDKHLKYFYMGIISGTSLGIIITSMIVIGTYDLQNVIGLENLLFIIIILWLISGLILFYHGNTRQGLLAESAVNSLKLAIPLFIGLLLFLFGIYLFRFGKFIETLIELFLGVTVIFYSVKQLKKQNMLNLITIGLISLALSLSIAYFLIL